MSGGSPRRKKRHSRSASRSRSRERRRTNRSRPRSRSRSPDRRRRSRSRSRDRHRHSNERYTRRSSRERHVHSGDVREDGERSGRSSGYRSSARGSKADTWPSTDRQHARLNSAEDGRQPTVEGTDGYLDAGYRHGSGQNAHSAYAIALAEGLDGDAAQMQQQEQQQQLLADPAYGAAYYYQQAGLATGEEADTAAAYAAQYYQQAVDAMGAEAAAAAVATYGAQLQQAGDTSQQGVQYEHDGANIHQHGSGAVHLLQQHDGQAGDGAALAAGQGGTSHGAEPHSAAFAAFAAHMQAYGEDGEPTAAGTSSAQNGTKGALHGDAGHHQSYMAGPLGGPLAEEYPPGVMDVPQRGRAPGGHWGHGGEYEPIQGPRDWTHEDMVYEDDEDDRERGRRRSSRHSDRRRHHRYPDYVDYDRPDHGKDYDREYDSGYDRDYDRDYDREYDREYRDRGRSSIRHGSHDGSQYDDEYDEDEYHSRGGRRRARPKPTPTSSVYIRGVPDDVDEEEVKAALEGAQNIVSVRIVRDKHSGASKGFCFVDFASVEDAKEYVESDRSWNATVKGVPVYVTYSRGGPTGGPAGGPASGPAGPEGDSVARDWVCNRCKVINFARRLECYKCCSARPAVAQHVSLEPDIPTAILKVSGFDPYITTDETLREHIVSHAAVKEVRMVQDKFTGAPRGLAFVHFHSVADATAALQRLDGLLLDGQTSPLQVCYARDKFRLAEGPAGPRDGPSAAAAAGAADAMAAYAGWQPKEFSEADLQAAADAQAASDAATEQRHASMEAAGFSFDEASGYYYHAESGYHYDPKTQLYYDNHRQLWCRYDQETGEYQAVQGDAGQGDADQAHIGQGDASQGDVGQQSAGATADLQQLSGGVVHVHSASQTVKKSASVVKAAAVVKAAPAVKGAGRGRGRGATQPKRGAVIGSKPQLNPEGVRAALTAAEEKVQAQLREQQLQRKQQQAMAHAIPAAAPAAPAAAAAPTVAVPPGSAGALAGTPVVVGGNVQGVVRGGKGKWARKT